MVDNTFFLGFFWPFFPRIRSDLGQLRFFEFSSSSNSIVWGDMKYWAKKMDDILASEPKTRWEIAVKKLEFSKNRRKKHDKRDELEIHDFLFLINNNKKKQEKKIKNWNWRKVFRSEEEEKTWEMPEDFVSFLRQIF